MWLLQQDSRLALLLPPRGLHRADDRMFVFFEADCGDRGGIKGGWAVDQLVKEGARLVIFLAAAAERLFTFLQGFRCLDGAIFERK